MPLKNSNKIILSEYYSCFLISSFTSSYFFFLMWLHFKEIYHRLYLNITTCSKYVHIHFCVHFKYLRMKHRSKLIKWKTVNFPQDWIFKWTDIFQKTHFFFFFYFIFLLFIKTLLHTNSNCLNSVFKRKRKKNILQIIYYRFH